MAKFWTQDPKILFTNWDFKPITLETKLNLVSQIILIISIILMICKQRKLALGLLVIGELIIIIAYYSKKESYCSNSQENYTNTLKNSPYLPNETMYSSPLMIPDQEESALCSKYPKYTPNKYTTKKGNKNCGLKPIDAPCFTPKLGVNPRIFVPPEIAPQISDNTVWDYPTHQPGNFNPVEDITEQYESKAVKKRSKEADDILNGKTLNNNNNKENYVGEIDINQNPIEKLAKLNGSDSVALNSGTSFEMTGDPMSDQMVSDDGITSDQRDVVECNCPNNCQGCDCDCHKNLKMNKSQTFVYTPEELNQPEIRPYIQTIQPNSSWELSWDGVPINSSLGISYMPQIPPTFRDQVLDNDGYHPFYTAFTPQFVRDEGLDPNRQQEMPTRGPWSAKENYTAEAGTINYNTFDPFSDTYDPRLTGHGDLYRSYSDVNLGQIDYYYNDVDAYRTPLFSIRNKVDHVLYRNPMKSDLEPIYIRNEQLTDKSLNEIKQQVEDQATTDEVFHREDMIERLMRKRNSEMWQLRFAPVKQQNNTTSIFV